MTHDVSGAPQTTSAAPARQRPRPATPRRAPAARPQNPEPPRQRIAADPAPTGRPSLRWVLVTDERGRTHPEARWV